MSVYKLVKLNKKAKGPNGETGCSYTFKSPYGALIKGFRVGPASTVEPEIREQLAEFNERLHHTQPWITRTYSPNAARDKTIIRKTGKKRRRQNTTAKSPQKPTACQTAQPEQEHPE